MVPEPKERTVPWWTAAALTALVLAVASGLALAPGSTALTALGRLSFDLCLLLARGPAPSAESPVVLVYLDRESYLREARDPDELWDRRLHARLVRRLTAAGARAVVFDIVFADPGPDPAADAELAAALAANGRTFLAAEYSDWRRVADGTAEVAAISPVLPLEQLRTNAAGWGLAALQVDRDYTVRHLFPGFLSLGQPSLTWAVRRAAEPGAPEERAPGSHWLRYRGPPLSLPNVSFSAALRPDEVHDSFFRNRIVIVGARPMVGRFPDRRDEYRCPWPSAERGTDFMPAAEVHATQLHNLIRRESLKRPAPGWEWLLLVLGALGIPALLFRFRPLPAAFVALLLEGMLVLAVAWGFARGWWTPWLVVGVVQIPGALAGSVLFRSAEWYRQRRRLEAARREAEAKIREQAALLDKAQDAILVRDLAGAVTYVNPATERTLGWNGAEWRSGSAFAAAFAPSAERLAAAENACDTQGDWTGELELATREGGRRIVQSRWTLIRDAAGHPRSRLLINTDITEKKQLEAQFLQAQRLETIGTLASGMAHDLNSALAPVLMGIQLIRRDTTEPEIQRLLSVMETNTYRGADMVRQVLMFSRGTADERRALDLPGLIQEVERILRHSFPRNIRISRMVPRDLWKVSGNATQLHQVLLNLCINARDALPEGGEISLSADNVTLDATEAATLKGGRPGEYVMLLVADTGQGIAPELLPRVFEPFFTTKPVGQGTGLGLATVARIVASHGGFCQVRSEVGSGTTFEIYLPRTTEAVPVSAAPSAPPVPRGRGEGVLVLASDRSIADLLVQSLRDQGYHAVAASSRSDGIALGGDSRTSWSVVLLDADVSDEAVGDGARLHDAFPGAAFVFMVDPKVEPPVRLPAGARILNRPFALPELVACLAQALDRTGPA